MQVSKNIAKHIREIHFGKNWTASSMKLQLDDITWEEAVQKVKDCNTIATLVYHVNYYITHVLSALRGGPFNAQDKFNFDNHSITNEADWKSLLDRIWHEAEEFANEVEKLPDSVWDKPFLDEKYGSYYRNIHGIIEHLHYHLGQIVFIKKWIRYKSA